LQLNDGFRRDSGPSQGDACKPAIRPNAKFKLSLATILERFANPLNRHELLSIALNSVSKWVVRVLPTVEDWVRQGKPAPDGLAFSLAALLWFYRGDLQADGLFGRRAGSLYPIRDDAHVLDIMVAAWAHAARGEAPSIARRLLAEPKLWGRDLTTVGDLAAKVETAIGAIEDVGVRGALDRLGLAGATEERPGCDTAA